MHWHGCRLGLLLLLLLLLGLLLALCLDLFVQELLLLLDAHRRVRLLWLLLLLLLLGDVLLLLLLVVLVVMLVVVLLRVLELLLCDHLVLLCLLLLLLLLPLEILGPHHGVVPWNAHCPGDCTVPLHNLHKAVVVLQEHFEGVAASASLDHVGDSALRTAELVCQLRDDLVTCDVLGGTVIVACSVEHILHERDLLLVWRGVGDVVFPLDPS